MNNTKKTNSKIWKEEKEESKYNLREKEMKIYIQLKI